jgi:hypothetical protein
VLAQQLELWKLLCGIFDFSEGENHGEMDGKKMICSRARYQKSFRRFSVGDECGNDVRASGSVAESARGMIVSFSASMI